MTEAEIERKLGQFVELRGDWKKAQKAAAKLGAQMVDRGVPVQRLAEAAGVSRQTLTRQIAPYRQT